MDIYSTLTSEIIGPVMCDRRVDNKQEGIRLIQRTINKYKSEKSHLNIYLGNELDFLRLYIKYQLWVCSLKSTLLKRYKIDVLTELGVPTNSDDNNYLNNLLDGSVLLFDYFMRKFGNYEGDETLYLYSHQVNQGSRRRRGSPLESGRPAQRRRIINPGTSLPSGVIPETPSPRRRRRGSPLESERPAQRRRIIIPRTPPPSEIIPETPPPEIIPETPPPQREPLRIINPDRLQNVVLESPRSSQRIIPATPRGEVVQSPFLSSNETLGEVDDIDDEVINEFRDIMYSDDFRPGYVGISDELLYFSLERPEQMMLQLLFQVNPAIFQDIFSIEDLMSESNGILLMLYLEWVLPELDYKEIKSRIENNIRNEINSISYHRHLNQDYIGYTTYEYIMVENFKYPEIELSMEKLDDQICGKSSLITLDDFDFSKDIVLIQLNNCKVCYYRENLLKSLYSTNTIFPSADKRSECFSQLHSILTYNYPNKSDVIIHAGQVYERFDTYFKYIIKQRFGFEDEDQYTDDLRKRQINKNKITLFKHKLEFYPQFLEFIYNMLRLYKLPYPDVYITYDSLLYYLQNKRFFKFKLCKICTLPEVQSLSMFFDDQRSLYGIKKGELDIYMLCPFGMDPSQCISGEDDLLYNKYIKILLERDNVINKSIRNIIEIPLKDE